MVASTVAKLAKLVVTLSEATTTLLRHPTFRLPDFSHGNGARIDLLDVGAAFVNPCGRLSGHFGDNSRIEELAIRSNLKSGARGCPIHLDVSEGVYLDALTIVDDPGAVTGGLGNCRISIRKQPRFGSRIRIVLGADWAFQADLWITVDGDTVTVHAASVIPVIKFYDRAARELVIQIGFEPLECIQRNPSAT